MKICIANDHRGVKRKKELVRFLEKQGYEVINLGTDSTESTDYPIYAFKVGELVAKKEADFGILLCRTGIGMSIAANKVKGIRCAKVNTIEEAKLTRIDNDSNVIAIKYNISLLKSKKLIKAFLETETSMDERHVRRRNLVDNYD